MKDILLPSHETDFQNSYGFVQYNIHMNPNLTPGTIIEQKAHITYNYGDPYWTNTVSNTVVLPCLHQDIPLNSGWNMISSYIQPDHPDMDDIISEISSNILLIKNGTGQAVIPSSGINQIGNWNSTEGYQVKTSASTSLIMGCAQIDPIGTPISLTVGWSIIPYLRNTAMNTASALTGIEDDIFLMKDYAGDTYIPAFGINNIGNMEPGKGYKIKMSNADTLTYPANSKTSGTSNFNEPLQPNHFVFGINTGSNATIIVPNNTIKELLSIGDEIGVFNENGDLSGAVVYEGGHLALTVWGDDVTTKEEIEGMLAGHDF